MRERFGPSVSWVRRRIDSSGRAVAKADHRLELKSILCAAPPIRATFTDAKRPGDGPGLSRLIISAVGFRMRPFTMLARGLRVQFGTAGVLPALGVVALAMCSAAERCSSAALFAMKQPCYVRTMKFLVGYQLPASRPPPNVPIKSGSRPTLIGDARWQLPTGTRSTVSREAPRARYCSGCSRAFRACGQPRSRRRRD